jgi:hypothetical protein
VTPQPRYQHHSPGLAAISTRPAACITVPPAITARPPSRSIVLHASGDASPVASNANENPPSTAAGPTPRPAATGSVITDGT